MNHEELLARIDDQEFAYDNLARSLMAIVKLHKPFDFTMGGEPYLGCNCGQDYPCPTIQAITEELK